MDILGWLDLPTTLQAKPRVQDWYDVYKKNYEKVELAELQGFKVFKKLRMLEQSMCLTKDSWCFRLTKI